MDCDCGFNIYRYYWLLCGFIAIYGYAGYTVGEVHLADIKFGNLTTNRDLPIFSSADWPRIAKDTFTIVTIPS